MWKTKIWEVQNLSILFLQVFSTSYLFLQRLTARLTNVFHDVSPRLAQGNNKTMNNSHSGRLSGGLRLVREQVNV